MDANQIIKQITKNSKARNIIIFSIIIIVLSAYLVYSLLNRSQPPPGALRVVMCTKCEYKYILRVTDINDPKYVCKKCGGKLGYAWKCDTCDYEYPYLPLKGGKFDLSKKKTAMDVFRFVVEKRKCPQCGSTATSPISIEMFTGKTHKKKKKHKGKK